MWMIVGANGYRLQDYHRTLQSGSTSSVQSGLDPQGRTGFDRFNALAIDNGKIVAVGDAADLRLQLGALVDRVVDVEGATVIPGLIDSHLHVAALGEHTAQLDLTGVASRDELLAKVRDFSSRISADRWVVGGGWDDNRFAVKGLPTLAELDEAAGGRPLLLTRVCHHAYLVNQAALRAAQLTLESSDPDDGYYGRDEHGRLNGQVFENASRPILKALPEKSREVWKGLVRVGMETALKQGITGVHTDDVRSLGSFDAVANVYHTLIYDEGIRLRVHELVNWASMDEALAVLEQYPYEDEWFTRGAAKLFSDGALGSRTAWFSEPYSDQPGWSGTAMYAPEELMERVRAAHEKGFGAAVHAIGDAAVDLTLRAMAAAPRVAQRDRLIHAEVIRPDLLPVMQAFGDRLAVDVQPRFTVSDFPWLADRVGPHRVDFACAWRMMQEAGIHIAGGSDAPIEPVAPLLGIHAAHTRRRPFTEGAVYGAKECLSARDAVMLFTSKAAYAAGQEGQYGTVEVSRPADLTILSQDIVNPAHPDDMLDAEVLYTVVGGEIAYAHPGGIAKESVG